MAAFSQLRALWRNLLRRNAVDAHLDAELDAAFDLFVEERVAAGTSERSLPGWRASRVDPLVALRHE
jgi:hypothetical protein